MTRARHLVCAWSVYVGHELAGRVASSLPGPAPGSIRVIPLLMCVFLLNEI
jgi:hypothetical protein